MLNTRHHERLIVLFILGVLVWNYPLLHLFGSGVVWLGIPVLFLYLFFSWLVLIVLLALLIERQTVSDREGSQHLHSQR